MTNAINNNNPPRNTAVKVGTQTRPDSGNASASPKNDSSTTVDLGNANLLQRIQDQIQQLPDVNTARIESVKRALANGEYQPDAEVIAKKFSEIERLLP